MMAHQFGARQVVATMGTALNERHVRHIRRFVPRVARRGEMPVSGRGLDFMRRLMDEVDVQPGAHGTCVRFAKRRDGAT